MSKVRVYEVARELGVENRELIQTMAGLGIQVRNHMSVLEVAEVDRVKRALDKERSATMVEERIRPTVVRRKRKKKAPEELIREVAEAAPVAEELAPAVAAEARPEPSPAAEPAIEAQPEPTPEAAAPVAAEAQPEPAPAPQPATEGESAPAVEASPAPSPEAAPASVDAEPASTPEPAPLPKPRGLVKHAPPSGESGPPPSASEDRFAHAILPPGVTRRGNTASTSAVRLSDADRQRIVAEHAATSPRRREIKGRAAIGPTGRPQGRPGKKRMAPGKKAQQTQITVPSAQKRVIRIEDQIALQVLAGKMSLKATDVLMKLMQMGMSGVHINSTLDADTAALLATEFNYEVENVARTEEDIVGDARGEFADDEGDRQKRAPIVTVMGHVDHGKTSLLDKIRSANVADGEAGGITQHISAFRVDTDQGTVVFLDTPGHEAFTSMRARGAQATDIVILVCAADDGVMPQTREAVSHSQEAGVPIVVAVNKIDRPDANPEKVMNELAALGLQPEDWGGDVMYVPTSAISGEGIDKLLESVLLQAELLELSSNAKVPAEGVVLEAYLDRGRGPVANVLVRNGTLKAGDHVVAGSAWGRVRALTDDRGKVLKEALPATPVEVLGLAELPSAGDMLYQVTDQRKAQEVASASKKASGTPMPAILTAARGLDQLQHMLSSGDVQELKLVVKADVQGSVEALIKSLTDVSTDKVKVNVIHSGVGGITENDVMLASASNAIILGFGVRPQGKANSTAKKENVEIRAYTVIYEAIDDVKAAMVGLLAPKLVDRELGKAEVRETFSIPKIGLISGCMVVEGKMLRSGKARLVRDGIIIWDGPMGSLRRFKEDAKEVPKDMECGIGLQNFSDVKAGDIIECYEIEEVAATLE